MPDLLIELFSEEIPARMQARACADLKKRMTDGLVEAGLTYASAAAFATPRRLVLAVDGLPTHSPSLRQERKGPRVGAPQKALDGFLRATGLERDALQTRADNKGEVYVALIDHPGRAAAAIVAEVLEGVIRNFPWPKSMRWGNGSLRWVRPLHSILCLLSAEDGAEVVALEIDGIIAGDSTEGHRFMAPGRFSVTSFDDYAAKLKRAHVMLDATERAAQIWHDATNIAFAQGLEMVEDPGLLAEVAGLVEWPVVLIGAIGADFLELPAEVLQTSMREHQKFFSVRDAKTGRIVKFATVANRETSDGGATILAGNQKVLGARLADAKFFWDNDLRLVKSVGMEGMAEGLEHVTFHNKLGSQADRVARIAALARDIAPMVGAEPDLAAKAARVVKADLQSAMVGEFPELQGTMGGYYARAAGLPKAVALACKAHYQPLGPSGDVPDDPVSVAVALADKIDTLTGFWAIDEKPTGSKDPFALRRAALGVIRLVLGNGVRFGLTEIIQKSYLALILVLGDQHSHFYSGLLKYVSPEMGEDLDRTWNAPPFDLIICRNFLSSQEISDIEVKLVGMEEAAFDEDTGAYSRANDALEKMKNRLESLDNMAFTKNLDFPDGNQNILSVIQSIGEYSECWMSGATFMVPSLLAFFHDRLKVHLRDEGIRHDVIDACLAMPGNDDLTLLVKRARALAAFLKTDDGENLVQGFKRANNFLTQAEAKDGVEYSYGAEAKLAQTPEEKALFAALDAAEPVIAAALASEDFAAAMATIAALRAPIDAFFEAVQVNTDNQIVRRNRLNLLHRIRETCLQVADLTKVEG